MRMAWLKIKSKRRARGLIVVTLKTVKTAPATSVTLTWPSRTYRRQLATRLTLKSLARLVKAASDKFTKRATSWTATFMLSRRSN